MTTFITLFINTAWKKLEIDTHEYSSLDSINSENTYITIQSSDFIRYLKSINVVTIPSIIDLECFLKQFQQVGNETKNKARWKALSFLKEIGKIDNSFKLTKSTAKEFMKLLAESFQELLEGDSIEKKRFQKIEKGINRILYESQLKGIRFNSHVAKIRAEELESSIYQIKNTLQFDYGIFDPENVSFQYEYLKKKNYRIVKSIGYTIRIKRKKDPVCELLYELNRLKMDFNSILTMLRHYSGEDSVHPTYKGFGTITSRITMREPSIQNMKRENRDIIIPSHGKEFLYLDYGQFEAGILASLSGDSKLIDLYEKDIYSDIAANLLGSEDNRDQAKIIFYRFMYGDDSFTNEEKAYFKKFKKLLEFADKTKADLSQNGIIFSQFGNGRKVIERTNWALSHKIQSTASLIYKNALLRAKKEVPTAKFVIPMHDATLYEISSREKDDVIPKLIDIYKHEFKKVCPEINPIVEEKLFYGKEEKT